MNTDKAYLFGLIIGGGIWGNAEDVFQIHLPFKQWGSYESNPRRAAKVSRDIMSIIGSMFRGIYGINISYEATVSGNWRVLCEGDLTRLESDLLSYGIKCEGSLRGNADISKIVADLVDDNLKRRFIAGLADTIGSTTKSHRRFTDDVQILSFELTGFNFSFVCELCRLLYSVNCLPDQILWNHPNFHSTNNLYYKQWTKGFKLRVQMDQYAEFGAFAFSAKAESLQENRRLQQQPHTAVPCPKREVRASPSCVHPAENDIRLPANIRGGHFLHNRHVCAVLKCENAPYDAIDELLQNAGSLVNPFTILSKDSLSVIENRISADPLLANRKYLTSRVSVKQLYERFRKESNALLYGNGSDSGYPLSEIIQGIAYVIAHQSELSGTRPKGNYAKLIERHLSHTPYLSVKIRKPDLLTPLVITGNGRGVLIGARNPRIYKKLVTTSSDNKYKLQVRPITEEDLRNEK
jgi:hypothetical protein